MGNVIVQGTEGIGVKTTCPYCGVGCGVQADKDGCGSKASSIVGDEKHPANAGQLCVKGSSLKESLDMPSRLLYPRTRDEKGLWQSSTWSEVTDTIAEKIHNAMQDTGPDSVAMYVSGQLLTEDYYVANKLMKGFVGSANIDTNSRLCMSSAVAAHTRAFGEDIVPVNYQDVEKTDLLVIVGANTAWTHPILYRRIQEAKQNRPEMKIVVIDPRKTVTAEQADLHLSISNDGDVTLFNGLLKYCVENQAHDADYIEQFTEGFDELWKECDQNQYALSEVSKQTGISIDELELFYRWFAQSDSAVTLFCQGVNQSESGTDKANAIINAHLCTGKIGRCGCGPFSITGQPNAMGGREVGGLANQLAVHRGFDADSIQQVGEIWQAPNMATQPGLKAVELFQAVERGDIKVLWVMATNPVVSMPDNEFIKQALKKCDCVIVSDITGQADVTEYADILLPAAGWGEKEGMVTNSERVLSRQRAFISAPGEAKPDWWSVSQVGQKLCKKIGVDSGFNYLQPADIFREYAKLTSINSDSHLKLDLSQLIDITDEEYSTWEPNAWPFESSHPLDKGYSTPSGKAKCVVVKGQNAKHHSWWLNSGRQRDQWHTMTRTGHIEKLSHQDVEPSVHMNQNALDELGVKPGELVSIASSTNQSSRLVVKAKLDEGQQDKQLFMSMHWAGQYGVHAQVNKVVEPNTDPFSGQPAFKSSEVLPKAYPVRCYGIYIGDHWKPEHEVYQSYQALSTPVWRFASNAERTKAQWLADFQQVLNLDIEDGWLAVHCSTREGSAMPSVLGITAISTKPLSLNVEALLELINKPLDLSNLIATVGSQNLSKLICSCFKVTDTQIVKAIETQGCESLQEVQAKLKCGTNCGSCLPEVTKLVDSALLDDNALKISAQTIPVVNT